MGPDEGDFLGNLPRSRPGTRSGRREPDRPADSAERAARSAEERSAPSARMPPAGTEGAPETPADEPGGSPDALGQAVDSAARLAGTGWRVATFVPREVLRRLPRP